MNHKQAIKSIGIVTAFSLSIALGLQAVGIIGKQGNAKAEFDIVMTNVVRQNSSLQFTMKTSAKAGTSIPTVTGKLAGSRVFSYVWPTNLDSSIVGFEEKQGILALAATAHPDFDDTPLFDENNNNKVDDDGKLWHSHWVVLVSDDGCGKGALKVKDIPEGTTPKLPATWPKLPILIDSPGYEPSITQSTVTIKVPLKDLGFPKTFQFDGVTAALQVNANLHAPLLCVTDVFDIASGNLSLPGVAK